MKRAFWPIAKTLCVLLTLILALIWLRTYGHQDTFTWPAGIEEHSISTFPGGVTIGRYWNRDRGGQKFDPAKFSTLEYGTSEGAGKWVRPDHDWTELGFGYHHHQWLYEATFGMNAVSYRAGREITTGDPQYQSSPNLADGRSIDIPFWPAMLVLLIAPARSAWRRVRFRRRGLRRMWRGLCPHCGYDLRAARDRCPECGAAVIIVRVPVEVPAR